MQIIALILGTGGAADSEKSAYDFAYRQVNSLPLSIGADGWATFAAPPVPVIIPQGCVAYVASGLDEAESVAYVDSITSGTVIAANTGILLRGTPSSVVELVISESGCQYKPNLFRPSVAATIPATDVNTYTLVCDGNAVSFNKIDNQQAVLPAHSCYLAGNNAAVQAISVIFPGNETGIDFVTATPQKPSGIYNVHGQQLRAPQRGINIIDGKKVLVK